MAIKFSNNASATLASSITNSATSITLTTGQGALFPSLTAGDIFYATLIDASNNLEIVKVTARSTDTLTVVRAQNNTLARAFTAGDKVELRPVAAIFDEFVQVTSDQTIAGVKTFSSGIIANVTGNVTGNVSGNAGTVTNGVYTTGNQTIAGTKTFSDSVIIDAVALTVGTASTGAGGNIRHKKDDGTVQWVAGILGSAGATSYEWYNNIAGTVRLSLDTSGSLTAAGNVTANSDERLKKDWAPVGVDFVSHLAQVKSGTYTRIDIDELRQAGVSAQSLQEVLPEAVLEDHEGTLSVAYGNAALVAAIELAKEVVALKQEIQALKGNQ